LTVEERGQLVEFAIKTSKGRRPVCAGTASESFEATASLIDRFDKAGADFGQFGWRQANWHRKKWFPEVTNAPSVLLDL
jgi:hypothetical protein